MHTSWKSCVASECKNQHLNQNTFFLTLGPTQMACSCFRKFGGSFLSLATTEVLLLLSAQPSGRWTVCEVIRQSNQPLWRWWFSSCQESIVSLAHVQMLLYHPCEGTRGLAHGMAGGSERQKPWEGFPWHTVWPSHPLTYEWTRWLGCEAVSLPVHTETRMPPWRQCHD